jgi:hypothetical protein
MTNNFEDKNLSAMVINHIFMAMAFDANTSFIIATLIPTLVGAATAFIALITYWKGQLLNRKDLIIPLMKEFDNSEDLFLAKAIMDDFTCNIPPSNTNSEILKNLYNMSQDDFEFYNKSNLKEFLRDHRDPEAEPVTSIKERTVRRSFDSMIYFFFKLEYLYRIGLLKKKELYYFKYYMNLAFHENDTGLWDYVDHYKLPLDRNFVDQVTSLKEDVI